MSEAKFTKGPWVSMVKNDDDAMMSFYGVGIGKSFLPVSTCGNSSNANAHLIAAAPEMYEFIKRLIEPFANVESMLCEVDSLLAKARGELCT